MKNLIKKHEVKYYIGAIAFVVAIFTIPEKQTHEEYRDYCDMVEIYEDSKGMSGWPDYKNVYEDHCGEK